MAERLPPIAEERLLKAMCDMLARKHPGLRFHPRRDDAHPIGDRNAASADDDGFERGSEKAA